MKSNGETESLRITIEEFLGDEVNLTLNDRQLERFVDAIEVIPEIDSIPEPSPKETTLERENRVLRETIRKVERVMGVEITEIGVIKHGYDRSLSGTHEGSIEEFYKF